MLRGNDQKLTNKKEETLKNIALGRMQAEIQATRLMQTTQNQHRINQKIVKNNIGNQYENLDNRLKRRRTNSNRSTVSSKDEEFEMNREDE